MYSPSFATPEAVPPFASLAALALALLAVLPQAPRGWPLLRGPVLPALLFVVISLIASLITALYFIPAFVCRRPGGLVAEAGPATRWSASRLLVRQRRLPFVRAFGRRLAGYPWRRWYLAPLLLPWMLVEMAFAGPAGTGMHIA